MTHDLSSMQQGPNTLRLLSYNIHVGLPSKHRHLTLARHLRNRLSIQHRLENLVKIADLIRDYDFVALQEIDSGSLRTGFVNQVEYLADKGDFPYWHHQINRNLGKLAQFANALLSMYPPTQIINHKLPGTVPGRGAIEVLLGKSDNPLVIIIMHLALGRRSRFRQLSFIRELIEEHRHVVLMGDMNCSWQTLLHKSPLKTTELVPVNTSLPTFPSWRPRRAIDHVLVSPTLQVNNVEIISGLYSDHLPIGLELSLPEQIQITR